MKKTLAFFLFIGFVLPLMGQKEVGDKSKVWERGDSIVYSSSFTKALTLLSHLSPLPYREVAMGYKIGKSWGEKRAFIPSSSHIFQVSAEEMKKWASFSFRAKAYYKKNQKGGLKGMGTSDLSTYYPFLVLDTIVAKQYAEQYHLLTEFVWKKKQWGIGVGLNYKGALSYSRKDPRMRNTSSSIGANISFSYNAFNRGVWAFVLQYAKGKELLSFVNYADKKSAYIFILRPFGFYNFRYTHREDYSSYRHINRQFGLRLQYALPKKNVFFSANLRYCKSQLNLSQAGVFLNEMHSFPMSYLFQMDLYAFSRKTILTLETGAEYIHRLGIENVYKLSYPEGQLGVVNYEFLAANKSILSDFLKNDILLGCRHYTKDYLYKVLLGYRWQNFQKKALYLPYFVQEQDHKVLTKASFSWVSKERTWQGKTSLQGAYAFYRYERSNYPSKSPLKNLDKVEQKRALGGVFMLHLEQNIAYYFSQKDALLRFQVFADFFQYEQGYPQQIYVGSSLAYLF